MKTLEEVIEWRAQLRGLRSRADSQLRCRDRRPEVFKQRQRDIHQRLKGARNAQRRSGHAADPRKVLWGNACARARKVGVPLDEMDWRTLTQPISCECCGASLVVGGGLSSPSLDRIVPAKGYVYGNIAWLCKRCNSIKNDASADDLERVAAWLRKRTET